MCVLRSAASWLGLVGTAAAVLLAPRPARAQDELPADVARALELEADGRYREAAMLFRASLAAAPTPHAALGLERAYAELGLTDSLLAPLDTAIIRAPREPVYRTIQLRSLQLLRREDALRQAFERWVREVPRDPAPFSEYARLLLQRNRSAAADSVLQRAAATLGTPRALPFETAQLRAAQGAWTESAEAWRATLASRPELAGAAAYALTPAPSAVRDSLRAAFLAAPLDPGARRAAALLELAWGRPREAWEALRALPSDTASATLWVEFGDRALAEERFVLAREALGAALRLRWSPELARQAALAALRAGEPADVFTLAPLASAPDSVVEAREYVPLHVQALVALGRVEEAEALVHRVDARLTPGLRTRLAASLSAAWSRAGQLGRAAASLRSAGEDADSSEAGGWIALYAGRLAAARALLATAPGAHPAVAPTLGLLARIRADSAPEVGRAFLALARGDSGVAAAAFADAASTHREAAPALLFAAARLRDPRSPAAAALWERIVTEFPAAPEAAASELEWARLLRIRGEHAAAAAHLEHLILSAPGSALVPSARRELELLRGTVPPS